MPFLTPQLLFQLKEIVRKHHTALVVNAFGPGVLPSSVVEELKKQGLIDAKATPSLDNAYLYGQVMAHLEDPKLATWSQQEVLDWVKKNPIPLTPVEKHAAQTAAMTGALYCAGLGNIVEKETGQLLVEADHKLQKEMRDKISDETAMNVAVRATVKDLKSAIGHATKDWTRNLDRIAITEKHNAMQAGVADGIKKKSGNDARVAFNVMPDACASCRKLYIGPDGTPRIFKLSELAPVGANVGKKQSAWVACIGAVHPHCQCQMIRVPVGWGFDEDGVLTPGGKFGIEYEEKSFVSVRAMEDEHLDLLEKAHKLAGKLEFQGMPISIEQAKGDVRFWRDRNGETGKTVMQWPYGYVRGTEGVDGDHVDVYVGPNPLAQNVFIVHQRKKIGDGRFGGYDEDKCMLGFGSADEAKRAYMAHYNDERFFGGMTMMTVDEFKGVVEKRKGQPIKGEAVPGHRDDMKLTISLEKAKIPTSEGGQTLEQDISVQSGGGGVMLQVGAPPRPIGGPHDFAGVRAFLLAAQPRDYVIMRDPKTYQYNVEHPDAVFPLDLETGVMATSHDGPQVVEREHIARMALMDSPAPRNLANPGMSFASGRLPDEEVEKGNGVIAVGPKGGKITGYDAHHKPVYASSDVMPLHKPPVAVVKLGEVGPGAFLPHFAVMHGGRIEAHPSDPSKMAVKLPPEKKDELESFRTKHGIVSPILEGHKNVVLPMTSAEVAKVHAAEKLPGKPAGPGPIDALPTKPLDVLRKADPHESVPSWKTDVEPNRRTYGGILFDGQGRILLRQPTNNFDGYGWTFPKGHAGKDHPVDAGLREVQEETGHEGEVLGAIPGEFHSHTGSGSFFFLMRSKGVDSGKMDWETSATTWATFEEAKKLIETTTNEGGRKRDLAILEAAFKHHKETLDGKGNLDETAVPAPPKPVVAPESFDHHAVVEHLQKVTGLSKAELKEALTGSANATQPKSGARARIVRVIMASGKAKKDSILHLLAQHHDKDAVTARVSATTKGSPEDVALAVKEFSNTPLYDLQVLSQVTMTGATIQGQAKCNLLNGALTMGKSKKTGDYVTGDFRHELGHAVHGAFMKHALNEVVEDHYTSVQKKMSSIGKEELKKPHDSVWYEEKLGVTGPRGLDNLYEDFAEHYRCFHRAVFQQRMGGPSKGSVNLTEYRKRHPQMAAFFDAHYTAALLGAIAKKGGW